MAHETAYVALADGTIFPGRPFGARDLARGEAVFTTSLVGYPEVSSVAGGARAPS